MKKRILFVDDEASILNGLKRSLRGQRKEWEMVFVDSGLGALEMVNEKSFDAVVTDMRMPGIDGAQLLELLTACHPELIRIILSGHSDEEMIIRSAGTAHQFLAKPCNTNILIDTLLRAFFLRSFLGDGRLHSLMTGLKTIPCLPQTYQKIMNVLHSPDVSLSEIAEIINTDPAMMAKILQLVNSSFFGLSRQVSDSKEASKMIGLDAIRALVLSAGIFSQFDQQQVNDTAFSIESQLEHTLAVAKLAGRIAQAEGADKALVDDCFLAGMLHNVGLLILEQNFSEDYVKVRTLMKDQKMDLCQAEQAVFDTSHGAVGAYLLGLWALPNTVVEAVAFHHQPQLSSSRHFSPLTAVHVADALIYQAEPSASKLFGETGIVLNHEFLAQIGLADRLGTWEKLQLVETKK